MGEVTTDFRAGSEILSRVNLLSGKYKQPNRRRVMVHWLLAKRLIAGLSFLVIVVFLISFKSYAASSPLSNKVMSQFEEIMTNVGNELDWFQSQYGSAKWAERGKNPHLYGFIIRECLFTVGVVDGKITSIGLGIEAGKCDLRVGERRVSKMTMADFYVGGSDGQWQTDCINCGNSHDPLMSYVIRGLHASGYVDTEVSTYDDIEKLWEPMRQELGDDVLYSMRFDLSRFDSLFRETFKNSGISEYRVGTGLYE